MIFQAEIDCSDIHSKRDFMRAMDKAFGFPPYFGENWDALWDFMRDMYWINESEVMLKIRNGNDLTGKLKFQIITFFEELKVRLDNPKNPLERKMHFDYEFVD